MLKLLLDHEHDLGYSGAGVAATDGENVEAPAAAPGSQGQHRVPIHVVISIHMERR